MNSQSDDPRADRDRRRWLQATAAALVAAPWASAWAQPASAAAEEAKAPPLPALGSPLTVPRIGLLGGGVFAQRTNPVTAVVALAAEDGFEMQAVDATPGA